MTSCLATFEVYSAEFSENRRIDLIEDLDDKHLEFVKTEWGPRLADSRARAIIAYRALPVEKQNEQFWQNKQAQFGAPDSHWDWHEKKQSMLGSAHRMLALIDREAVEALMRVDLSKPSKINPTPYLPVVYVDYLAVAPWNRPEIQTQRRFKGFGKLLLGAAVSISIGEGMDGRCGLHSLPQSEGFYTKAGMNDLGVDSSCGLKYFEFAPHAAKMYLET